MKSRKIGYLSLFSRLSGVFVALILLLAVLTLPASANTLTAGLQVQAATVCPQGCSCMAAGQAANMQYVKCFENENPCGYDSAKQPLYCYKPQSVTCPLGCECLSEGAAKEKFGAYTRCSETACGAEPTVAAVIPRYCVKRAPAVTLTIRTLTLVPMPGCPSGCECMPESQAAQEPNRYVRCSETACSQYVTGSAVIKSYCYRTTTVSPAACPYGCSCMPEAKAKEAFGSYEQCSKTPCSAGSATTATAAQAPEYCFRVKTTPSVCSEGCDCITPDDAKLKFGFLPDRCSADICGYYQPVTIAAAAPIAKYCFKRPTGTTPTVTQAPVCPQNCACLMPEEAKKLGFPLCQGAERICGYSESKQAYYCYEKVPSPQCVYDYQKNACSGTCGQGYTCGLVYTGKDESGKVTAAVCNCIPPPLPSCTFDKEKKTCAGTCQTGGQCMQIGLSQGNAAAPVPMCGCDVTKCYFDYAKDSCAGSCSEAAESCILNTLYRDAATGKTTYAECHCKGKGEGTGMTEPGPLTLTTAPASGVPCGCSAATFGCSGDCPAGQTCFMTGTTLDTSGKNVCKTCECKAVCQLDSSGNQCTGYCPQGTACQVFRDRDPASGAEKVSCGCTNAGIVPVPTQEKAPDMFTSIGNFFRSLFGIK